MARRGRWGAGGGAGRRSRGDSVVCAQGGAGERQRGRWRVLSCRGVTESREAGRGRTERWGRGRTGRVKEGGAQWGRGEKKACERKDRESEREMGKERERGMGVLTGERESGRSRGTEREWTGEREMGRRGREGLWKTKMGAGKRERREEKNERER
ncbi:hypothetical protein MRB53_002245 [Persea americana]|uniref:Uncharacterized protein n=1 Tax=Persea americana TaxID=3435 RepID=A0ACC2MTY0_PERAE|nr:hypothetical protein MRB53_002245 [Persea americana]